MDNDGRGLDQQNVAADEASNVSPEKTAMTTEDYVKKVGGWAIYGYHPNLKINGVDYPAMMSFYSSGQNEELLTLGETGGVGAMRSLISFVNQNWQFREYGFENPSTNMFVSVTDVGPKSKELHPNQKIIQIGFFNDNTISKAGRGAPEKNFSLIGLLMPAEIADKFDKEIQENPDLVNELMTKALNGLDTTPDQPGFDRYKASNLIYVPADKIEKIIQRSIDPHNKTELSAFINECPKIPFKNGPYGVKDFAG